MAGFLPPRTSGRRTLSQGDNTLLESCRHRNGKGAHDEIYPGRYCLYLACFLVVCSFIHLFQEARERPRHRPILMSGLMRRSVDFSGLSARSPIPFHWTPDCQQDPECSRQYERKLEDLRLEGEFEKGLQREVRQPLPTYLPGPQE